MTFWVDAPGTVAAPPLAPRECGSNDVTCASSDLANTSVCRTLIETSNGDTIIGEIQRAVCIAKSSNTCCTRWSRAVGRMPAANKIRAACFSPRFRGRGLAHNVNLNGQFVTRCLSKRPDAC
ncbi:hypothetical protein B0H17DRAFT_1138749 [Mycena rosella]|uniref:WD-like domain-containing protein n=1 Tax=Mycena rosella TaxID=1033263 RepID=A0AAD7D689_MYCRO|nr:hypothetical protein B0H17DRAFT_1138749 [Mycena rosella]